MRRYTMVTLVVSLMLLIGAATASADPFLAGSFSASGNYLPVGSGGVQVLQLSDAKAFDMIETGSGPTPGVAGPITVNSTSGNFVGMTTPGMIKDFTFIGGGVSLLFPAPTILAWETFGDLTIDLTAITSVLFEIRGGFPTYDIAGNLLFHKPGFADTKGSFIITANQSGTTFSYSSSQTAVPEPATIGLIGVGLFGLAIVGRRRKAH